MNTFFFHHSDFFHAKCQFSSASGFFCYSWFDLRNFWSNLCQPVFFFFSLWIKVINVFRLNSKDSDITSVTFLKLMEVRDFLTWIFVNWGRMCFFLLFKWFLNSCQTVNKPECGWWSWTKEGVNQTKFWILTMESLYLYKGPGWFRQIYFLNKLNSVLKTSFWVNTTNL